MKSLLLIAIALLLVWIVLVFDVRIPLWIAYLLGVMILLLFFAWIVSIFKYGSHSDGGRGRAL